MQKMFWVKILKILKGLFYSLARILASTLTCQLEKTADI